MMQLRDPRLGRFFQIRRRLSTQTRPLLALGPSHYFVTVGIQSLQEATILTTKQNKDKEQRGFTITAHNFPITLANWSSHGNILVTCSNGNVYVQLLEKVKKKKRSKLDFEKSQSYSPSTL